MAEVAFLTPETRPETDSADPDASEAVGALYGAGIIARKGAFSRKWAAQMREDIEVALAEAESRPNGAVGRGPNRYYVEIHPEQMRGFVDLVDHPWVRTVCNAVLGEDYEIVELGFDVPGPGAMNQPWHRDFPMPDATRDTKRLTSLAFNLTAVDMEEEMGPFEIAPGTQWATSESFEHGMFPLKEVYSIFEERAERKYPKVGDISARSALTIHRGTRNYSDKYRPVLVLGVDAPGAGNAAHHDMAVTRPYWDALPERVPAHMKCPVVDVLEPITQKHDIEGLMMGEAEDDDGC